MNIAAKAEGKVLEFMGLAMATIESTFFYDGDRL